MSSSQPADVLNLNRMILAFTASRNSLWMMETLAVVPLAVQTTSEHHPPSLSIPTERSRERQERLLIYGKVSCSFNRDTPATASHYTDFSKLLSTRANSKTATTKASRTSMILVTSRADSMPTGRVADTCTFYISRFNML